MLGFIEKKAFDDVEEWNSLIAEFRRAETSALEHPQSGIMNECAEKVITSLSYVMGTCGVGELSGGINFLVERIVLLRHQELRALLSSLCDILNDQNTLLSPDVISKIGSIKDNVELVDDAKFVNMVSSEHFGQQLNEIVDLTVNF